ncbi:acyltransferase [Sphingobacterium detergens]|uniref:acyltransferase n=1 Tax=Sphingobacterium detergens TaxID=1145106 RepID=UPI003AAD932E
MFKVLSYIFGYSFFSKLNILFSRLISLSINRKLKSSKTVPKFQYPSRIEGVEYIKIGRNFAAGKGLRLQAISKYKNQNFKPSIEIGDNVVINPNCQISAIDKIVIGNNVLIASYVFISDHVHGETDYTDIHTRPADRRLSSKGSIMIDDGVWIGQGVCILSNVRIGKNVIIGANSVVTRDVPDNTIVVGTPARIIKNIG